MIADNMIPFWQHFDLTQLNASEQTAKIEHIFHQQTRRPFNFDQGPLLRLYLLTLSGQKHILLVCLPTLCADSVALRNLVHEMSRAYDAVFSTQDIGEEPLQYVDFCAWQEEMLETEDEDAALGKEYWRKQNVSSTPALLLPYEDKGDTQSQFAPRSFSLVIDPDAIKRIDSIVRQYDTSVSEFFLACWQTVLWKLTGQSEFIVAREFDGRTIEDLHTAVGLFARSLPILCRIDKDRAFSEVLSHVNEATRTAGKWQDYFTWETPLDVVDETIHPDYFPVAFSFHELLSKHDAAGLSFSIDKQHVCFEKFKLKLNCSHFNDSLAAEFQYDSDIFAADDIERLAGQFHTLLTGVLNNTEASIGELEVLSDLERQRLLVEWNDTKSDCSKEECVHQLFEEQAVRAPDNIAVLYEDQQLTYKQLNSRANQLAHYLRGLGVSPETRVALCVDRSVAMIIGLMGILKAGGAYVPLDPTLPKERLTFMLGESQASVLLTQQHLLENLPEYKGRVICLDADWNLMAQQTQGNPISGVTSKNLAYVLFTSGSTGNSKGVAVEHQQLLNYLHGILPRLDLPVGANVATVSTFAADLGNTAIFPSLCTGGCLHLISRERASDPNALADYFAHHLIDCVKIVPPHLEALLNASRPECVLPRQRLVLGGEAASWDLIKRLQALAADCVILNHYGPTEATVGVTTYRVENGQRDNRSAAVPIGRPIANTKIYLLDTHLRPVPIWISGELYIGGANVSRGYLNQPELTAEKFVPDPFSAEPGARVYKTGDLARYLPDGNIEFLGRIDNQVKIRGFRIELGEIESVLGHHPAVRKAVVLAREDNAAGKRLVAYVVPGHDGVHISQLRDFLTKRLPDYMIPSAVVFLDSLPLTSNGKVNRKALPPPDPSRPELESAFVAPRSPTEELVAKTWAEVLKLEEVGIHDNFFDLGGHSLLATQVISRLREAFRLDLPLRSLFESPTIAGLAERIETLSWAGGKDQPSDSDNSEKREEMKL
jgi:amino acid adenylation domain-containing protein